MDIREPGQAQRIRDHQNGLLERDLKQHLATCPRGGGNCFKGRKPIFFYIPEPEANQLDVPDSLQPGHGLKLHLPLVSTSSTVFCEAVSAECVLSATCWDQTWKVQCLCPLPGYHPHLLDLLCVSINKEN